MTILTSSSHWHDAKASTAKYFCLHIVTTLFVLQGVAGGFIDKDTPLDKRTTVSLIDGSVYHLVSFEARTKDALMSNFKSSPDVHEKGHVR